MEFFKVKNASEYKTKQFINFFKELTNTPHLANQSINFRFWLPFRSFTLMMILEFGKLKSISIINYIIINIRFYFQSLIWVTKANTICKLSNKSCKALQILASKEDLTFWNLQINFKIPQTKPRLLLKTLLLKRFKRYSIISSFKLILFF